MSKEAEEIVSMFSDISNKIRANRNIQVFNPEIKQLTIGQEFALQAIYNSKGKTMGELAKMANVKMPTMTENIGRLYKLGFVERHSESSDRRKVFIRITEKGKKVIEKHMRKYIMYIDMFFKTIKPGEKKMFRHILNRVLELLNKFK